METNLVQPLTDTHLVIVKDGQLLRLSAEELRQQAEPKDAPTP